MQLVLDQLTRLERDPDLPSLGRLLEELAVGPDAIRSAVRPDLSKPYGRNVILQTEEVEGMVATWSPGFWCWPHDHGGSVGGVRVLRGAARHRLYRVRGGALELMREERLETGEVLRCGPGIVHAMCCAGEGEGLVTLHLYAGPIPHMVVYEPEAGRTWVVDGGCGAWIPHDQPHLVRACHEGILSPELALG